jgi:hypothetical protein
VNSIDLAATAQNAIANALHGKEIAFATAVDGLIVNVNRPSIFVAHRAPEKAGRNGQQFRGGWL